MRMGLLYSILENRIHMAPDELHLLIAQSGIKTDADSYLVLLFARSIECNELRKIDEFLELKRVIQRYAQKESVLRSWDSDDVARCTLLVASPKGCIIDEIREIDSVKGYLIRHHIDDATIVSGGQVRIVDDLHFAYERASNTLNFVGVTGETRVCFSKDYEHLFELPVLQSIVEPEHILRLFSTGTLEELRTAVTKGAEQIRNLSGYADEPHHPTSIRRTFIEWTVYVLHVSADMGVDVDAVLGDVDPYRHLMTMTGGTPAIVDWFVSFCEKLREAIRERQETKEDQLLHRAKALIDREITNYDLSLTMVSQKLEVSSAYLSRLLTKKLNSGFSQYLTQRRMEIVCDKLATTELTVEQIAMETGFSTGVYLGRRFKQMMGVTPNQYRLKRKAQD